MDEVSEKVLGRIGKAWAKRTKTSVVSQSIYTFNLDEHVLRIDDQDFILVGSEHADGIYLEPQKAYVIKQIRATAQEKQLSFVRLEDEFSPRAVVGGIPIKQGVSLWCEPNGPLLDFSLKVSGGHRFEPGRRYRIGLRYSVPLKKTGPLLVFSGAIQPSDYDVIRSLGIKAAAKAVTMVITRRTPFTFYPFEPSRMNYCPRGKMSPKVDRREYYRASYDLRSDLVHFNRATYFTMAVDLS